MSGSNLSHIDFFFQHQNKTKATNFTKLSEGKLLYCTHRHTNFLSLLISLFHRSQLRFYYEKLLDTAEVDRQVLGFINPVLESDDEVSGA